ncbi:Ribonuclease H-like protein [Quillaja saponaria]|uniref:Ribonuclease H-like protein n=1 Tax=Quillaja saponaria TaxID=32244 RepID=A0AAD7VHV9_QUISA|nr:Ribonuclease H-like protein [Quillaja saponaria]
MCVNSFWLETVESALLIPLFPPKLQAFISSTVLPFHSIFFSLSLKDWIVFNLNCNGVVHGKIPRSFFFSLLVWRCWKWRSKVIFVDLFTIPPNCIQTLYGEAEVMWQLLNDSSETVNVLKWVGWRALLVFLGLSSTLMHVVRLMIWLDVEMLSGMRRVFG